ncbi:MAG: DUF1801 domain-containing protein [Bacteroidales bacterium]|nr:DUF1801 domain-containing protein [Bacteroidales bacterium]
MNGEKSIQAWLDGIKPEQRLLTLRVDNLIRSLIPNITGTTKWHKPSQPLGVPFYGIHGKGWIVAMWSFKEKLGIGFFAGSLLHPEPPVTSMAGPWNRGTDVKARRIDIHNESEFDETLIRSWLEQARDLPGWGKIEK